MLDIYQHTVAPTEPSLQLDVFHTDPVLRKNNGNRKATLIFLFISSSLHHFSVGFYKTLSLFDNYVCISQETDRMICSTNILHQADQTLRRIVSQTMKEAKGMLGSYILFS